VGSSAASDAASTTTIGLDISGRVLQAHGADATGHAVLQRRLRREEVLAFFTKLPACLVGVEACATAHYWARELRALGHEVRLIPPAHVKPVGRPWLGKDGR
jgi:transposase